MIELKNAIEIIHKKYPEMRISCIGTSENGWIFSFVDAEGKGMRISPLFVSNQNGEVKVFFLPDHKEECKNIKFLHYDRNDL